MKTTAFYDERRPAGLGVSFLTIPITIEDAYLVLGNLTVTVYFGSLVSSFAMWMAVPTRKASKTTYRRSLLVG